ncbi:MAG: prepilin-type N-terminal cleavage/methylation domain-containing protein [Patescibacteria group bacterium]|nr:prepilin-type N-terminal cleavage/methylation domain-containing protein [Patescibacteria group bacterium]
MIKRHNQKGFSLLEVVVAIFVIMVGLVAGLVLIYSSTKAAGSSKSELLASNLAREVIEVVRNERDSNWLEIDSGVDVEWDAGLQGAGNIYEAILHFNDTGDMGWTINYGNYTLASPETIVYYNDPTGAKVYNQYIGIPSGIATSFRRLISTNPICYDGVNETIVISGLDCGLNKKIGLQILVTVQWDEQGNTHIYNHEDRLYNWK